MNNYCTIYLVRHGQSEANHPVSLYGLDKKLTEKGKEQAQIVAKKLKEIKFDIIFASDLVRAQETAAIIAKEHQLEVLTKKALRERHTGALEGRVVAEVAEELKELMEMRLNLPYEEWKKISRVEGDEPDEQLMSRFITALREIAVAYPGKKVLIVSHQALMQTLLVHLGQETYKDLKDEPIKNTGYIKLESDGVDFYVLEVRKEN